MEFRDFSNMDGEVLNYDVVMPMNAMKGNPYDEDNFYSSADGDFSYASGKKRKKRRGGFGSGTILDKNERARRRALREDSKAQRNDRRNLGAQSRAYSKAGRTEAKLSQAETQRQVASTLGNETESDKAIAAALAKSATETTDKPAMSTAVKISIGVGVLLVVGGIVAYVIYKNKSKKGK
jgi:hypothetical protein